jgi:DNA-binding NarL/FixJ family response regulator
MPAPTAQAPRVLIADDSPAMRAQLRALLEDDAITVVAEAADGNEAVLLASTHRPDVILMDMRMPHLNGVGATMRICRTLPSVRVVMFTTFENPWYEDAARAAGASAFLPKGCPPGVIVHTVHTTCRHRDHPDQPGATNH